MEFYRYEEYYSGDFYTVKVRLITLNLHKETPQGYWIGWGRYAPDYLRGNSRWVSKTGRKRYAYPTKEEAMTSFLARKEKQVKILKAQLRKAEGALHEGKKMTEKVKT